MPGIFGVASLDAINVSDKFSDDILQSFSSTLRTHEWYEKELVSEPQKYFGGFHTGKPQKEVIKSKFPEINNISIARTTSKPPNSAWNNWISRNIEDEISEINKSDMFVGEIFDLRFLEKGITNKFKSGTKSYDMIYSSNKVINKRAIIDWFYKKSPSGFFSIFKLTTKSISNFKNLLIFKGYLKNHEKTIPLRIQFLNILRLKYTLENFNNRIKK